MKIFLKKTLILIKIPIKLRVCLIITRNGMLMVTKMTKEMKEYNQHKLMRNKRSFISKGYTQINA